MSLLLCFLLAHGEEEHDKVEDTVHTYMEQTTEEEDGHGILDHLHNKLVHFPIALTFGALVLNVWAFRRKDALEYSTLLLVLSGISALLSIATGLYQARGEGSLEDLHRILGIASSFFIWLYAFTSFKRWLTLSLILGIFTVLLLALTGYYGGYIAHG